MITRIQSKHISISFIYIDYTEMLNGINSNIMPELFEQEEGMTTHTTEMTVAGFAFLFPVHRARRVVHV